MTKTLDEVMLPADVVARLRAKVDGERFKSEGDVIRESLIALEQREESFESWLREIVYPAQDDIKAHPEKARSGEQVRARIASELRLLRGRS